MRKPLAITAISTKTHGFRPRHTAGWTLEDYQRETERLRPIFEENCKAEAEAEAAAIVAAEATISKLIDMGAADRNVAIRWMAEPHDGNLSILCYEMGVPYGYFKTPA